MNTFTTDLENFIIWFTEIEEIPEQTRVDFINHLQEVGTLDEKSIQFVDKMLEHLGTVSQNKANELKQKFESVQSALNGDKMPEISMKENIIKTAGDQMMETAVEFKEDFKSFQLEKNTTAETAEQDSEDSQVEALKAKIA